MSHPRSVLFVLPWDLSLASGVNQVVINLARETASRGLWQPIIFCADSSRETFQEGEFEGIRLVSGRLRAPLSSERPGRNLAVFAHKLRNEMRVWRAFLEGNNIQVVNLHHPDLSYSVFALMRILRRIKAPLFFSLHGTDIAGIEESAATAKPMARWVLRQGERIVCCSEHLARRAQASLRLDEGRICTIHNGIDIAELERSMQDDFRPDIGDFDSYLVNVAAYEHRKGQDLLLQAYTTLLRDGLKSALVLIGRSTPYLQTLRGMARQLGLQDHVFFIPDLDHSSTLSAIRHARLLVQPSREEAFGLPLLEAGYLGTPITAARTGGIPEVLGSYYPYMFEPGDAATLAAAIDEALFNPTETAQQIKLMKRRVSTAFAWGTAYNRYESLWS
jgi:glycosyltransferase involved in cell wall biosynthesis